MANPLSTFDFTNNGKGYSQGIATQCVELLRAWGKHIGIYTGGMMGEGSDVAWNMSKMFTSSGESPYTYIGKIVDSTLNIITPGSVISTDTNHVFLVTRNDNGRIFGREQIGLGELGNGNVTISNDGIHFYTITNHTTNLKEAGIVPNERGEYISDLITIENGYAGIKSVGEVEFTDRLTTGRYKDKAYVSIYNEIFTEGTIGKVENNNEILAAAPIKKSIRIQ